MKDIPVSSDRVALLHPKIRQEVIELVAQAECGLPATAKIRIAQGLRTKAEQDAIYALGRTVKNSIGVTKNRPMGATVTNAKWGQSMHSFGLAIDFCIMYDKDGNGTYEALSWDENYDFDKDGIKDWHEVVKVFKAKNWVWGGDFKSIVDNPHMEKSFGYTWKQLLELYNNKKVDKDGYVLI